MAPTTSGAADDTDRTLGQTPADAVGDTTKTSMVDEYVEHGRLCAATDRAKLEARVATHHVHELMFSELPCFSVTFNGRYLARILVYVSHTKHIYLGC